jgi:hypothetical protein
MLPGQYGNSYHIVQSPGVVAIRYEMVHDTRVIPVGETPRAGPQIRSDMGVARGRWEPLTMNDQEAVLEYACHEGNQAIRNILSAARTGGIQRRTLVNS